jgi:drug/metabolite transporter (DMT)-like permease
VFGDAQKNPPGSSSILLKENNTLVGIGWMLTSGLLFVCVTGIVRHLGSNLPAAEAAFLRYAFGLVLIAPVFFRLKNPIPAGALLKLYFWRGMLHGLGVILWFYAMARIPIADVTAIGYTTPIFITIGAAVFLGERLRAHRIAALAVAFVGMLVILRPGLETIKIGAWAQIAAAPLFAGSLLLAKHLSDTERPADVVAMLSVFCTLVLLPFALWEWKTPTGTELAWLFLTSVFATTGHYALTKAFAAAPITVTQPVTFLQLIWATLIGVVLFDEQPDTWLFVGGAIIVGAVTYIAHRETVAARRRRDATARGDT